MAEATAATKSTNLPAAAASKSSNTGSSSSSHASTAKDLRKGFQRLELNRTIWEVPDRYFKLQTIGSGAYGQVCSAEQRNSSDSSDGSSIKVAIKKLTRPFQSAIHAKRTYREFRLLKQIKHENVIGLLDVFSPASRMEEMSDIYFVTHFMGADLNQIIKTQKLSDDHVQFLVYQVLRGLKYIHSAGIIHRDLKPSNLAVNEDCELRILDFGLARQAEAEMTGYVATRWYRAPEIMLNWMHYNQTVDVWSVGCIMAELMTGKTLFPGTDHIDQLHKIMTVCGTPDKEFMAKITSEDARNYLKTVPTMKKKSLKDVLASKLQQGTGDQSATAAAASLNPDAIDLLSKMLELDADRRPTATQALAHPYLSQYADPNDEPVSESLFDDSFEDRDMDVKEWRRLIWDELEKK